MIEFYTKDQFEEKLAEVEAMKTKKGDDYFFKYMKIILSFGKPIRLTENGYKEGIHLHEKWQTWYYCEDKQKKLTREENILAGFLLSDIAVLEESDSMSRDLQLIYNQMVTMYKPDFQYMQDFGQNHLLKRGYVESNPNYMVTVEQMFTQDYVIPDAEHSRMINTGEMPIYEDVKVCPYCGKQFGDDVELLFKHVKSEHDKK